MSRQAMGTQSPRKETSAPLQETLELQLSEVEMLLSMFPGDGELTLEDANAVNRVKRYLEGGCEVATPSRIEFAVMLSVAEPPVKIVLHVCLPHQYPSVVPELFARSAALDRLQQRQLNEDLISFVNTCERGELCISLAIQWIQDNCQYYIGNVKPALEMSQKSPEIQKTFYRMWIYSHHIYRHELRKKILDLAKKLGLTGFCLTGKPGVICIEGVKQDCEEFWHTIRYPNWKHISCKHTETIPEVSSIEECRVFKAFEELIFEAHGDYGLRNDYHMDLGQFLEYLKEHKSEHVFHILFGIEGRSHS
ncbi:RWD domain-containing protein 2A-like [Erpetoichthys calabaricus]|uniref:RWD domain containing 2A n=1 Tax=Erpetoichthys calabaricus TaxID=27687 RepID=A0A8C4RSL4_ERPCA|nr:RWD domain-containing protein 2A-like [Erpetoichthys calabaricus]